ncbi:MAG: hypothetical protein PVF56_15300 [Desulfobacterales bacterium]|jgi:alkylation response protein AidB-like acyl-CoA dehydrogenase
MDFSIPNELTEDLEQFKEFIKAHIKPQLTAWNQKKEMPRQLFRALGEGTQDVQKLVIFRELVKKSR